MKRALIRAAAAVLVFAGVAQADQFRAIITEVNDGKVTIAPTKFNAEEKKFEKGASRALPVADGVKVAMGKFEQGKASAGDPIEGGLKNAIFTKIPKEGVTVVLTTEDGKITEILLIGGKK